MNQTDIDNIASLLNTSIREKNWEHVIEALEYIQEFQDDPQYEEE